MNIDLSGFSMGFLIASTLINTIGFAYFIYGKKSGNSAGLWAGVAMMIFPYFIHNVVYMVLIGVVLCALPFFV